MTTIGSRPQVFRARPLGARRCGRHLSCGRRGTARDLGGACRCRLRWGATRSRSGGRRFRCRRSRGRERARLRRRRKRPPPGLLRVAPRRSRHRHAPPRSRAVPQRPHETCRPRRRARSGRARKASGRAFRSSSSFRFRSRPRRERRWLAAEDERAVARRRALRPPRRALTRDLRQFRAPRACARARPSPERRRRCG